MTRKPPAEWKLTFPAVAMRCENCGHVMRTRSSMAGRYRQWILKGGRGWREQDLPKSRPFGTMGNAIIQENSSSEKA
jgi:hypothetical protein